MKVAVYEPVHLDWVIPFAELLAEEKMSVTFIVSGAFKNDLQPVLSEKNVRYNWQFINPDGGLHQFSKQLFSAFKHIRYDLVIINTIDSRHLIMVIILMLCKPKRILLNIHAVNNFFKIKPAFGFKASIRAAGKKMLRQLADGYIVNAASMKAYMLENHFTQKPVYWVQPVYYKPSEPCTKTLFTRTIVIPGSIDCRRRDYLLVLEVIQQLLESHLPVAWILAGKPWENYGAEIIAKAGELNSSGAAITFYRHEIPEEEFQRIIAASTLLLSPLVSSTTIHDNIPEIYGATKGSGNVYDAIRHAKPIIVPATVIVPEELATSCITYCSKDDLMNQLFTILTDNAVLYDYQKNAEKNAEKFSKERVKNMFTTAMQATQ